MTLVCTVGAVLWERHCVCTAVLDYIKNNCTKQLNQNQEAAERIRGHLNDYKKKLKELEEALKEAKDTVQRANTQNTHNAQNLNDQLVHTHHVSPAHTSTLVSVLMSRRVKPSPSCLLL